MPEPQQPTEQPKESKWLQRAKNWITTGLIKIGWGKVVKRTTGQQLKYKLYRGQPLLEVQPALRLKEKNLLNIMENRSKAVSNAEANWDFIKGKMEETEDIYAQAMIYLDTETGKWEFGIYQNGAKGGEDEYNELEIIEINDRIFKYPVPPRVKIRYSIPGMKREWRVTVSPFGYNNIGNYISKYDAIIDNMCEEVEKAARETARTDKEREAITQTVGLIKSTYKGEISRILNDYRMVEYDYYQFVKGQVEELKIEGKYAEFAQQRPIRGATRQNFLYPNIYRVIQPIIYGKKEESSIVKDKLELHRWTIKPNELGPGLDEFGYPLEVDDDGVVMIDKHPESTGPVRTVPEQFIRNLDLLEMTNYLNNFHDTFRDDLRDGRYHPKSLTIMEYVEANNKSIWNLWNIRDEDSITQQSKKKIRLNGPEFGDREAEITIKPSDKNPAFDLSLIRGEEVPPWRHAGRKYYYDIPDGTMKSKMLDAHISSRGVSMYIIEKLTREMQMFDKEAVAVLNEIGLQKGGFDYGTRPWDIWGKTMIPNIYAWRQMMEAVNKDFPIKHTVDEYKQIYNTKTKGE